VWSSPKIELRAQGGELGVFARASIDAGERLVLLAHVFVDSPSQHTIQLDARRHQAGTSELDDYFNHSCAPNCLLDVTALTFVAARAIAADEQLSFNYLTTEWSLDAPFSCWCAGPECVQEIRGFKHLPRARQLAMKPVISPFLRRQLATLIEQARARGSGGDER
jgi:SET domain-containing protein